MTLDEDYKQVNSIIMEEAEKIAKSKKESANKSERCDEIHKLNEKRKALKPFRQKSRRNQIEYTELNKTIRKMRRENKRKYRTRMVKEVLESNKGPKIINRKLEGGRKLLSSLRSNDGTEVTNKAKITDIIEEFYKDLYNTDRPDWRKGEDWSAKADDVPPIMEDEVEKALDRMKKGKAPGEDQLTADILKLGGPATVKILTKLFNKIIELEQVPTEWN